MTHAASNETRVHDRGRSWTNVRLNGACLRWLTAVFPETGGGVLSRVRTPAIAVLKKPDPACPPARIPALAWALFG